MGRKRQSKLSLPPRMHFKAGCYYHVSSLAPRKWVKLSPELAKARIMWAQIESGGDGGTADLFNDRLDAYLVSAKFLELAATTRKQYEHVAKTLRVFFNGATIDLITPAHIARWLDGHQSKVQANIGKSVASNVLALAVRHGLINANPCSSIDNLGIKGRDRLLSDGEFQRIWELAQTHVQIAMDLGYLTGSRIQDMLDIKLQDIVADGVYIKQGKTGKKMLFLWSDALTEVIARARALPRPIRGMHLLCTHTGQPYLYNTFNRHWLEAVREAGIEELHFHDIRAKAATDAETLGMDFQALLGHASRAMSEKYLRLKRIQRVEVLPKMGSK